MPRTSSVAAAYPNPPGKRLACPDDFPPGSSERRFFLDLVASLPSNHFQKCDEASVAVYVAACVDLMAARGELKASGNIIDGKANPLIAVVRDNTRTINQLARSLRLNPVSRAPQQPAKVADVELSYYERQALERRDAN